ncbi:MAG: serine aminopeptidase domain-containing protein [Candidatus Binatia bacterium]
MSNALSAGVIEPFYFGAAEKPLFGCYHAPQRRTRDCAIVLCYPTGQEYIRSHRSYRQLAFQLSSAGFPVLRFDFYGCGDSAGDCAEGRITQWLTDLGTAVSEIKQKHRLFKICLVGLRLGGTLSMMAGAERGDIEGMVLWDPILSGTAYIEELTFLHQQRAWHSLGKTKQNTIGERPTEILGFPMTCSMLADLQKIEVFSIREKPASDILILASSEEAGQLRLAEHLKGLHVNVESQYLPTPDIWIEKNKTVVPNQILKTMVSWISRVYT